MIWLAFAVVAAWLAVLSILVVGLVRQIATLDLATRAGAMPRMQIDFDSDGPAVGSAIPAMARAILDEHLSRAEETTLLVLSPGCGTCLDVAQELGRRPEIAALSTFVVRGPAGGDAAEELRLVLRRTDRPIIEGEAARTLMKELNVNSVPFAVALRDNTIVDKHYVRPSTDLTKLLSSRPAADDVLVLTPAMASELRRGGLS